LRVYRMGGKEVSKVGVLGVKVFSNEPEDAAWDWRKSKNPYGSVVGVSPRRTTAKKLSRKFYKAGVLYQSRWGSWTKHPYQEGEGKSYPRRNKLWIGNPKNGQKRAYKLKRGLRSRRFSMR